METAIALCRNHESSEEASALWLSGRGNMNSSSYMPTNIDDAGSCRIVYDEVSPWELLMALPLSAEVRPKKKKIYQRDEDPFAPETLYIVGPACLCWHVYLAPLLLQT
jgi:hypothetical protein